MPSTNEETLKVGDVGSFESLSQKANPDNLVLDYIPPIQALFARAVQLKGEALTDEEVALIRARSPVMAVPAQLKAASVEERNSSGSTPDRSIERTRKR